MKTSLAPVFVSLLLLTAVSCHDRTNPAPVAAPASIDWKTVPGLSTLPLLYTNATPTSLLIQNTQGFQRIDSTNTITGGFDLTDSTTLDYPVYANNQYGVVYSYRFKTNQEPLVSIYDYSRSQQPLLSLPVSQFIRPVEGHEHFCFNIDKNCEEEALFTQAYYTGSGNYYGSGFMDTDGNLFLAFYTVTYPYLNTYFYHYYKLKLTADAQNKLSLQLVSDYLYQLNGGTISKLYTFNNQSYISYSTDGGSAKLVKVNPQGADQTVFVGNGQIDNVFNVANTSYMVVSTSYLEASPSDLWTSTDNGSTWQKARTLAPAEKPFFINCSTNNGALPLVAVAKNVPMRRTGIGAKTDTLTSPNPSVYKLDYLNQHYYLWTKDGLHYSANPPLVTRH